MKKNNNSNIGIPKASSQAKNVPIIVKPSVKDSKASNKQEIESKKPAVNITKEEKAKSTLKPESKNAKIVNALNKPLSKKPTIVMNQLEKKPLIQTSKKESEIKQQDKKEISSISIANGNLHIDNKPANDLTKLNLTKLETPSNDNLREVSTDDENAIKFETDSEAIQTPLSLKKDNISPLIENNEKPTISNKITETAIIPLEKRSQPIGNEQQNNNNNNINNQILPFPQKETSTKELIVNSQGKLDDERFKMERVAKMIEETQRKSAHTLSIIGGTLSSIKSTITGLKETEQKFKDFEEKFDQALRMMADNIGKAFAGQGLCEFRTVSLTAKELVLKNTITICLGMGDESFSSDVDKSKSNNFPYTLKKIVDSIRSYSKFNHEKKIEFISYLVINIYISNQK